MSAQELAEKWNAAQAEFEEGRFAESAALLLEHQQICRTLEDHESLFRSHQMRSITLKLAEQLPDALAEIDAAVALAEQLGNGEEKAAAQAGRAHLLIQLDRPDEAWEAFEEAEGWCAEQEGDAGIKELYADFAETLYSSDYLDAAVEVFRRLEQVCRDDKDDTGLQFSLANQAGVLADQEEWAAAEPIYAEVGRVSEAIGDAETVVWSLANRSSMTLRLGEYEQARKFAEEAKQRAEGLSVEEELGLVNEVLEDLEAAGQKGDE